MKKLPIKWKIMLWYTVLLIIILGAVLPTLYYMLYRSMYNDAKVLLQTEAGSVAESLEHAGNPIHLDSDVDLSGPGIYIAVYNPDNTMDLGKLPQDLSIGTEPKFGQVYKVESNEQKWFVLDTQLKQNDGSIGWFRAVKPLNNIDETLDRLAFIIMLAVPVYIAIALFGGYIIAKRSLSPIIRVTKTAQQIGQNDLSSRIKLEGPKDEIGMLAETFDGMLDRLETSFAREKRFSSDVSHELRTPTAAIMVNAEEALDGSKTEAEYKEALGTILKESKRMNAMISQLLMMARGDTSQFLQGMELIDISTLTKTVTDEYLENGENNEIRISAEIEDGIGIIAEQTLYMRLLINLIDNAMKYNKPGGYVKVSLKRRQDKAILMVEDNGIGISKNDIPKVWDRFFKVDPSRPDSSPGLGLSIVKWIADIHGASVHVKSDLGKGCVFEIWFKCNQ